MGNLSELLINVVRIMVPKLLIRHPPKWHAVGYLARLSRYVIIKAVGEKADPNPVV
jgi:hypothetical protein